MFKSLHVFLQLNYLQFFQCHCFNHITNKCVCFFQSWLDPLLESSDVCFYSYLARHQTPEIPVDGIIVTLMSAMIQRNITILHQDFQWTVDNMEDDIVMAYIGDNVFVQTKRDVGK